MKSKAEKAFKILAKRNNTSVAEVKEEIQKAIDEAINNTDPKIKDFWKSIPCKGSKPTPEEVVFYISNIISN